MNCKDCQRDCISLDYEIVCKYCGLVQSEYYIREELRYDESEIWSNTNNKRYSNRIISKVSAEFTIPDHIRDTAIELFEDYNATAHLKGEKKRCHEMACIYFAQFVDKSVHGRRSKRDFIGEDIFFCNKIEIFIKGSLKWKNVLLTSNDNLRFTDVISTIISKLSKHFLKCDLDIIKRKCLKLNDTMKNHMNDDRIVGIREENIYATMVYIVVKNVSPDFKKKVFAEACSISVITLEKVMRVLHVILF